MEQHLPTRNRTQVSTRTTFRDILMPLFRQRRLARIVFAGVLVGALVSAFLLPSKYEAEMKILVNRDRVDAVVTPDPNAPVATAPAQVITEEDLNSEVELLKSRDLLEQVVFACGLTPAYESWFQSKRDRALAALRLAPGSDTNTLRARAVEKLQNDILVEPLKKTSIIRVTYGSADPELSARVLQTLATLYQKKHAEVHRPVGTFGFFDQQAEHYQGTLRDAEARLTDFDNVQGTISPSIQQQLALQKLADFESDRLREQASELAATQRLEQLQAFVSASPERQTTQVRKSENAELLASLRSSLLALQLKHSDMLTKYAASYPPVEEISEQIETTQKAITSAEQSPIEDVTTDRVPAQDWIATELAKAQADRAAIEGQETATARSVARYRQTALDLDRKSAERADLERDVKTAEENYLLYQRKREVARISDALDNQRIVNVSIAETATVPALSTLHYGWILIAGVFAAGTLSVGTAYTADRLSPSFHSPDDVGRYLELRVLASIPAVDFADD